MVGGHVTNTLDINTHFSDVTWDSECIALIMTASHDLEVKEAEASNAYVMALNKELGDDADNSAILVRASNECRCIVHNAEFAQYMQE